MPCSVNFNRHFFWNCIFFYTFPVLTRTKDFSESDLMGFFLWPRWAFSHAPQKSEKWCPDKACVCWRLWELKVSPYQDCLSPKKGVKQRHWYDTNLESCGVTLPFFMWNIRTYRSNSDKYGSKNLDWGEKNNLSINLDSAVASLIIFSLWVKCEKAG